MTTRPPDPGELPAWAVEAVHLSAYDPGWPAAASQAAEQVAQRPGVGAEGPAPLAGQRHRGLRRRPFLVFSLLR